MDLDMLNDYIVISLVPVGVKVAWICMITSIKEYRHGGSRGTVVQDANMTYRMGS